MEASNSVEGNYIQLRSADMGEQTYIELTPPSGTSEKLESYTIVVVLDCSGSMCGGRNAKANIILSSILEQPNVERLQVIKFGSNPEPAITFEKGQYANIDADLGGTDFVGALRELIKHMTYNFDSSKNKGFVMFFSDGEAEHPDELYEPLQKLLQEKDIPLFSVAVSNDVDPELMVRLANIHGGIGLHLIKDQINHDDPKERDDMVNDLLDFMPIGLPIDEAKIRFIRRGQEVSSEVRRYRRGQQLMTIRAPANLDMSETQVVIEVEDKKFELKLKQVESDKEYEEYIKFGVTFVKNESKRVLGDFVSKKLTKEEAAKELHALKKLILENFPVEEQMETVQKKFEGVSDQQERAKLISEGKRFSSLLRRYVMEAQTGVNACLRIVETGEMKNLLEIYAGKQVSAKMNAQMQAVALRNQARTNAVTPEQIREIMAVDWADKYAAYLKEQGKDSSEAEKLKGQPARPLATCRLWFSNPVEDVEKIEDAPQNEWVGNATLVTTGVSSALDPWTISSVEVHPVKFCNDAVEFLKSKQDPQNRAEVKGYECTFNSVVPVLDPNENVNAVLLAKTFMRSSVKGQQQISKFFTNNEHLFNPAMFNALYAAGTLTTLGSADNNAKRRAGLLTFFTLLDGNLDRDYWATFLDSILADPIAVLGSREPEKLPNVSRALIPLTCLDKALQLPEAQINRLFYLFLVRFVAELTSEKYHLEDLLGLNVEEYRAQIRQAFEGFQGGRVPFAEPKTAAGEVDHELAKHLISRLATTYGLHFALRRFLSKKNLKLKELYLRFMNNLVTEEELHELGLEATQYSRMRIPEFLAVLIGEEELSQAEKTAKTILASDAPVQRIQLTPEQLAEKKAKKEQAKKDAKLGLLEDALANVTGVENQKNPKVVARNKREEARQLKLNKKQEQKAQKDQKDQKDQTVPANPSEPMEPKYDWQIPTEAVSPSAEGPSESHKQACVALLKNVIIATCDRHNEGASPSHNSEYITRVLGEIDTPARLLAYAQKVRGKILHRIFGHEAIWIIRDLRIRKHLRRWVEKARATSHAHPLHRLRASLSPLELAFTGTDKKFASAAELSAYLSYWYFDDADLDALLQFADKELPQDFKLPVWASKHRLYVKGFHREAAKAFEGKNSLEEFKTALTEVLKQDSPARAAFLEKMIHHFWFEKLAEGFIREAHGQVTAEEVLAKYPETAGDSAQVREERKQHSEQLIKELKK